MRRKLVSIALTALLLPALLQASALRERYNAESRTWRMGLIAYTLEGETARIAEILGSIDRYTLILGSYTALSRPEKDEAAALLQNNLESKKEVLRIQERISLYQRAYPGFNRAFMLKYGLARATFESYALFRQAYESLMDRWRAELERAIIERQENTIRQIQEDMMLLSLAIRAYMIFPAEASTLVPDMLRKIEDTESAIERLRYYISSR